MAINELEKVIREAAGKKDLHSIGEKALSPEFTEAARTLARRKGTRRAATLSLLSPAIGVWL